MPTVTLKDSPSAPDISPVEIFYREAGRGIPLLFLHGGWGYEVYPFDRQIEVFDQQFRILIPDRSGYGGSVKAGQFPADFHRRAAGEMMRLLDALKVDRAVLWGHSDGAVISALMGLAAPERFSGLILEAFHFYRAKPGSREFFEQMARDPQGLGERVTTTLAREHGETYWRELINTNGRAWLKIAEQSRDARHDLYDGELGKLAVPTLFLHGSRDPRTEPGELDSVRSELPRARIHVIEGAGHSPHSERSACQESNFAARQFLDQIAAD